MKGAGCGRGEDREVARLTTQGTENFVSSSRAATEVKQISTVRGTPCGVRRAGMPLWADA